MFVPKCTYRQIELGCSRWILWLSSHKLQNGDFARMLHFVQSCCGQNVKVKADGHMSIWLYINHVRQFLWAWDHELCVCLRAKQCFRF